jgi:hypothetical protein
MGTTISKLSEGISHIEDLPIGEFIDVLRNMSTMVGTEKIDGANLWMGLDEQGKFFTSREGKRSNSARRYKATDWPVLGAYNQFRAAHAALELVQDQIRSIMVTGDTVEIEVLFGRQPNAVIYGADNKSYIAFLRGVNGTSDSIATNLGHLLVGTVVDPNVDLVSTSNGEDLVEANTALSFKFTTPQKVDPLKLKLSPEIEVQLKSLEAFLLKDSGLKGKSNKEILALNLAQEPKDDRAVLKHARSELLARVQHDFKSPIKAELLDKVLGGLKSKLTSTELSADEDIGIEGIVLNDPRTGDQIKIVDKDTFSTINRFNQAVRAQIQSSLVSTDPDAPLESRGGLVGSLRIKIAEVLGNRDLAKSSNVRKVLEPLKGSTPEEAIRNFAASMVGIKDYEMIRKKILALTSETAKELKEKLADFKENQGQYRLKLKSGKELGFSESTVQQTLLTFAEARRSLSLLFDKVKGTHSLAQLLAILYGAQAKAVHVAVASAEPVLETLLEVKHSEIDHSTYKHRDAVHLLNMYLTTVLMTMIVYHEDDTRGLRLLRDRKNCKLSKFSSDMSPLNFWGYPVWRSASADMKKTLEKPAQKLLFQSARHIPKNWYIQLHRDFSNDKKVDVAWKNHQKTLHKLVDYAGIRSERLNSLIDSVVTWPALTFDQKVKTLNALFTQAQRFVPTSSLFIRIRVIQNNLLLNANGKNDKMVSEGLLKSISKLAEDEAGDPGTSVGVPVAGTASADIAALPNKVGRGAVVRRKRNPDVKMIMKFPDPRKTK